VTCWDAWQQESAPLCLHCSTDVVGQYYEADGGVLHLDCYQPWIALCAAKQGTDEPLVATANAHSSSDIGSHDAYETVADPAGAVESMQSLMEAIALDDQFGSSPSFDLGWMWKLPLVSKRQSWKRRWAVVRCGCLCYFKDLEMHHLRGSVELAGCTVRLCEIDSKQTPHDMGSQWGFELVTPKHRMLAFPVGVTNQTTRSDTAPWVLNLNEAIEEADLVQAEPEKRALQDKAHVALSRASMLQVGQDADNEEDEADD
jgi:hypothetical protein